LASQKLGLSVLTRGIHGSVDLFEEAVAAEEKPVFKMAGCRDKGTPMSEPLAYNILLAINKSFHFCPAFSLTKEQCCDRYRSHHS
jgi:hypothetical protein